jgi:hypothetical protein
MATLVVNLDEKLLLEFRSFAAVKHGRLYNVLKPEVELALKNHLANQKRRAHSREESGDV